MNRLIIYEYINKLKKEDIINYCNRKNIYINDNEINIIYMYIKNNYIKILDNPDNALKDIKGKLTINTYNEILKLYDKYKYLI